MKNQQKSTERANQRREIKKPTLLPRRLHFWIKDYELEANAKFGDASIFVFTDTVPKYGENDFDTYLRTKLNLRHQRQIAALDPELRKLEQRHWFTKRAEYDQNLVAMFNDMILHFSDESMNLL